MTLLGVYVATLFAPIVFVGNPKAPKLSAECAILIDAKTGRILFGKNIDRPSYPASTTKIMTGLLLAEKTDPSQYLTAPPNVDKVKGSSLHLKPGEMLTSRDMLLGLMLRSANDGAHSIAVNLAGSDEKFAELMNQRAKKIGCKNTTFYTPHGLNHPYHMTTVADMALIAKSAMSNPRFASAVATPKATVIRSINTLDQLVKNTNTLLAIDPTLQGIKTGYTNPAGSCFVGYVTEGGREFITVLFKSKAWKMDQPLLGDWAKSTYSYRPAIPLNRMKQVKIQNGQEDFVSAQRESKNTALLSDWDCENAQILMTNKTFVAPVVNGQILDSGKLVLNSGEQFDIQLVAMDSVDRKPNYSPFGLAVLAAASGMTYWMKSRGRKTRKTRPL